MLPEKFKAIIKKIKKESIHTFIHSSLSEHFTCFSLFFNIFTEQLPYAFSSANFAFHLHWYTRSDLKMKQLK